MRYNLDNKLAGVTIARYASLRLAVEAQVHWDASYQKTSGRRHIPTEITNFDGLPLDTDEVVLACQIERDITK